MYLGWPTYLIHGTNKPYGVGRRVSRGCIRMYPDGVATLYPEIAVGTPVTAVDQTVKLGWQDGELYLEAQPDFAQIDELEATQGISPRPPTDEDRRLILDRAGPRGGPDRLGAWPRPRSSADAACRCRSPARMAASATAACRTATPPHRRAPAGAAIGGIY